MMMCLVVFEMCSHDAIRAEMIDSITQAVRARMNDEDMGV